jgi:luciferase family oxidoreductase group 1
VKATPSATGTLEVWLLGSSDYSAQLAAASGLPYVFANHFSGEGLERALTLYRSQYQPSAEHPEPRTFVTANAVVSPTDDEAWDRALPQVRMMARLRTGRPLVALETVEEAREAEASDNLAAPFADWARSSWFLGTPADAASAVRAFATKYGVDEVMISPVAGAYAAEPMASAVGRAQTLELLSGALAA